jgi:hypothetical protein
MGIRADRLAADLKVTELSGIPRALAEEAVLVMVRLEALDRILTGEPDAWMEVVTHIPPTVAELRIQAPLAEARQQGQALRALLAEFAKQTGQKEAEVPPASKADELAAARARRLAEQAQAGG